MSHTLPSVRHAVLLCICTVMCYGRVSRELQQSPQDEVYEVNRVGENRITAPKAVYHPDPEYTDKARKKKISGDVLLSLIVTPEGTVRDAKVTTSLDKDLDRQALKTVNTWKFEPATKDGTPVAVRIRVAVSFRIR